MRNEKSTRWMHKGAALIALLLAAMLPLAAFAETATGDTASTADAQTTAIMPAQRGGMGMFDNGDAGRNVDASSLTDEQKTAYNQAIALYEGVEDAVLADLVTANVVIQADVDAYTALRAAEKTLSDLDTSAWTAEQYKAYYEANAKTGDERKTAMQALADAGLLTQEQADALAAQGEDDLWATISKNENTNTAIQTAMNTLQQARQTMQETLRSAGITSGMGNGNRMGGGDRGAFGMSGQAEGNNGIDGGNAPSGNMPQGGHSQGAPVQDGTNAN